MRRVSRILAGGVVVAFGTAAVAELPAYVDYQLQARAAFTSGFNLPVGSQITNATPAINDSRQVAFGYYDDELDRVMWAGQNATGMSISEPFFTTSDPSINSGGRLAWRVFLSAVDGVWSAPFTGPSAFVTALPAGASGWGSPQIADDGRIAYRADVGTGQRYVIYDPSDSSLVTVAQDGGAFSFLATPRFNNQGQLGARVWGASNAEDQLRLFEEDGSSVILAQKNDVINSFLNVVDLNDLGAMAFRADLVGGGAAVGIADAGGVTLLTKTTDGPLSSIPFFGPVLNNSGHVAFRGIDPLLGEGIYVADTSGMMRIIGVGDVIESDLGPATITGFSGGIDINNQGDVIFNAALSLVGGGSIGRGMVVALVPEPSVGVLLLAVAGVWMRRR